LMVSDLLESSVNKFSIKLTLYSNIKIPKEIAHRSRGCVICPNGKMLFTDKSAMNLVMVCYSITSASSFNNSFCTFGININDTYITRCGHCYSTVIDQGHH
jgi:hypothetical protein